MKIIVAALIEKNGKYLVAKRSADRVHGDKWEFPGGKVEAGESEAEALEREIVEEFNTLIGVKKLLATAKIEDDMTLKLYACEHKLGGYHLKDHSEIAWVDRLTILSDYDLAPGDIDLLSQIISDKRLPSMHELTKGEAYTNEDIMRIFLVSGQGGMRRSKRANSLILFALHHTGNPYEDKWDIEGIMHYTGMGLSGDQSVDYMQNKTVAQSKENGVDMHLFESYESNNYIYRGRVCLADEPYYEKQNDENDRERKVVKFPLRTV